MKYDLGPATIATILISEARSSWSCNSARVGNWRHNSGGCDLEPKPTEVFPSYDFLGAISQFGNCQSLWSLIIYIDVHQFRPKGFTVKCWTDWKPNETITFVMTKWLQSTIKYLIAAWPKVIDPDICKIWRLFSLLCQASFAGTLGWIIPATSEKNCVSDPAGSARSVVSPRSVGRTQNAPWFTSCKDKTEGTHSLISWSTVEIHLPTWC